MNEGCGKNYAKKTMLSDCLALKFNLLHIISTWTDSDRYLTFLVRGICQF